MIISIFTVDLFEIRYVSSDGLAIEVNSTLDDDRPSPLRADPRRRRRRGYEAPLALGPAAHSRRRHRADQKGMFPSGVRVDAVLPVPLCGLAIAVTVAARDFHGALAPRSNEAAFSMPCETTTSLELETTSTNLPSTEMPKQTTETGAATTTLVSSMTSTLTSGSN